MKPYLLFLLFIILLPGCLSLKSEYPEIEYFTLKQETSSAGFKGDKINATLLIRDFSVNENLETDLLIASIGDNKVERYYYYRWISDYSSIVTDFFVNRYNSMESFSGSVVKTSSLLLPDYVLEAHVLDMIANNSDDETGESNVEIKLQVSLLRIVPETVQRQLLFSKLYYNKTPRAGSKVTSIVPAFSKALSKLADDIFIDIRDAIEMQNGLKRLPASEK